MSNPILDPIRNFKMALDPIINPKNEDRLDPTL